MFLRNKYYQQNKASLFERENKKLDILFDEKKRAENNILFIVKTYSYVFGFLFVYTGFVAKTFIQSANFDLEEISFIKVSISILGLFLIFVISTFGKYGIMGIAHSIKKRLGYTYEINKIVNKGNVLKGLDIEHFLKIPVIYTWTITIIIAGSIFYFILMLGSTNPYALSGIMITSILGLLFFPKTNIQFFNLLNNYLISIYESEGHIYKNHNYMDKSQISDIWLKLIRSLIIVTFIICEAFLIFTGEEVAYRSTNYSILLSLLILIEYKDVKRKTNRKCIFDRSK